jgi:putative nucleotidyltransferase with HDIG domain
MMRLVCKKGEEEGKSWDVGKGVLKIGRDEECDVLLRDRKASRLHGEIIHHNGKFVYFDRKSTNGTLVNGNPVAKHILKIGDILTIGRTELEVALSQEESNVFWQEGKTQISSAVPVESALQSLEDTDWISRGGVAIQDETSSQILIERPDYEKLQKGIREINLLCRFSEQVGSVLSPEDLYTILKKSIFEAFPDVQHLCMVTQSEDEEQKFIPIVNVTRDGSQNVGFAISRSIFQKTLEEKVAILARDAIRDDRFSTSDSISDYKLRSVMCAPMISKGQVLGVIFADNRNKPDCFDADDLELFAALANQASQAIENTQLFDQLQKAYHETILSLINAMEARDPYTRGHTKRTSRYALGIARELGLDPETIRRLRTAAELHDIGKIGVKENIIAKDQELSNWEYLTVQEHVLAGEKILRPLRALQYVLPIIRAHHERYDGKGYPDSLKGEAIPLESRILAVADAFDAMTTQRPYNRPLSYRKALAKIKEAAGTQFDPEIVKALERFIASQYILTHEAERLLKGDSPADTTR